MRCPVSNCKKVQEAEIRCALLYQEMWELDSKCRKLQDVPELFTSIFRLFQEGYQVLGIEEKDGAFYAVVMDPSIPNPSSLNNIDDRWIYLYQLPYHSASPDFGHIGITIKSCCSVFIEDFEVSCANQGYGSMLLKNVISFYQKAGLRTILGKISPVDSDHLEMLCHFYKKFGFDVNVSGASGSIRLDLQKVYFPVIQNSDGVICCRGSSYSHKRSDYLLRTSPKSQAQIAAQDGPTLKL